MKLFLAALGVVLLLAGCGGSHKTTVAHPGPLQTVSGHACAPGNQAMQCVLSQLPGPPRTFSLSPVLVRGVDFAWGGPRSCTAMRGLGASFGASYFSYDTSGKNWTPGLVGAFHACGIATVGVWETTANRATQGFAAGRSDALAARSQAAAVGNTNRPIFFAIDCDCTGGQVAGYFDGVRSILPVQRIGAYGGIRPIGFLFDTHRIAYGWQTYAWSGGAWDRRACLEQYLNGNAFDYDRAICRDYGQWPAPKPPGPSPQVLKLRKQRNANLSAYHKAGCRYSVIDAPYRCRVAGAYVLAAVRALDAAHAQSAPHCWGKHASLTAAACQVLRPNVSAWSRARAASQRALDRNGCNGPANFPAPVHSRVCNPIRQRARFFDAQVRVALKEFG